MPKSSPTKFHAGPDHAGHRLDVFLVSQLTDISRARVQMLIDQQKVEVDGNAEKASYRLRGNELVSLLGPAALPPLKAVPEDIPLDVVYEDQSLAVVNKPAGMMVHAGAGQTADEDEMAAAGPARQTRDSRSSGTLVNALLHRFKALSAEGGDLRPGIVHRLDKDTSGLIVVAKNDSAHRKLAEQFASREVRKRYIALVHGWPKSEKGTINSPVGRDRVRRNRMSTRGVSGRDAVTHYKVLRQITTMYGKFALLDVTIETGRTHQIRVHLASIGNPVVGDTLYGAPAQIMPLDCAYRRARPADTKATRDRAVSDLTRELTEKIMDQGDASTRAAKKLPHTVGKKGAKRRGGGLSPVTPIRPASAAPKDISPISLRRNFLHAAALEFSHPRTGKPMQFERDLPQDLEDFLGELSQHN